MVKSTIAVAANHMRLLSLPAAIFAALAAGPVLAGSDYPPGLFENSPVVPHGYQPGDAAPHGPGPEASGPPADVAPEPYGAEASPQAGPYDGPPPWAYGPPSDFCAGIASRAFATLDEVRRAHARCDRALSTPPPRGYPPSPGY